MEGKWKKISYIVDSLYFNGKTGILGQQFSIRVNNTKGNFGQLVQPQRFMLKWLTTPRKDWFCQKETISQDLQFYMSCWRLTELRFGICYSDMRGRLFRVLLICEPASHASHNASHASHASQGASHASHHFNVKKTFNKEYYYQTSANTVQITVQIFSDMVQFFEQ